MPAFPSNVPRTSPDTPSATAAPHPYLPEQDNIEVGHKLDRYAHGVLRELTVAQSMR